MAIELVGSDGSEWALAILRANGWTGDAAHFRKLIIEVEKGCVPMLYVTGYADEKTFHVKQELLGAQVVAGDEGDTYDYETAILETVRHSYRECYRLSQSGIPLLGTILGTLGSILAGGHPYKSDDAKRSTCCDFLMAVEDAQADYRERGSCNELGTGLDVFPGIDPRLMAALDVWCGPMRDARRRIMADDGPSDTATTENTPEV